MATNQHANLAPVGLAFAGLMAGQAVYWFISGEYYGHSSVRNVLVVLQLVVGLGLTLWCGQKARRI